MAEEFEITDFTTKEVRALLYLRLLKNNGYRSQFEKLSEECRELSEATDIWLLNQSDEHRKDLVSEIVDVENMIEQIKIMIGVTDSEFNKERNFKLSRTISRYNL